MNSPRTRVTDVIAVYPTCFALVGKQLGDSAFLFVESSPRLDSNPSEGSGSLLAPLYVTGSRQQVNVDGLVKLSLWNALAASEEHCPREGSHAQRNEGFCSP